MNNKTRIILADPSEEFRILMRQVMEQEGDFEVIGSTGSGAEAMELVASRQPDVLVTEVVLPELDGFAAAPGQGAAPPAPGGGRLRVLLTAHGARGGGAGRSLLPAQALQRAVPARAHPGGGTPGKPGRAR